MSPPAISPTRSRRPAVLIALGALLGLALTLGAGIWQWGRAQQKEASQARWQQRAALPPLRPNEVFTPDVDAQPRPLREARLLHQRVTLEGRWVPQHTVYLDNRQMNGRVGFYVLTPWVESQSGRWVLVQRGWVPRDAQDRSRLPIVDTPDGLQTLTARIVAAPSRALELGANGVGQASMPPGGSPRIRQNLQLEAFGREIGHPLWDFLLLQVDGSGPAPRSPPHDPAAPLWRDWPAPQLGVEKHLGYAFQWFGLATLIASLYVWFQVLPFIRRRR